MIISILAFLIPQLQAIQFAIPIGSKELRCFGENIGQNILVVGQVQSNSSDYSFKIHIPAKKHDNILTYSHSQEITKFSFTTNHTQFNYQFCIHNLASNKQDFNFTLNTGTEAQDFSLLAQKEDLKPLELHMKKLNSLINAVENDQKSIEEKQAVRFSYVATISYKVVILSCVTLVLMMLTNLFQAKRLKKFFMAKKLI